MLTSFAIFASYCSCSKEDLMIKVEIMTIKKIFWTKAILLKPVVLPDNEEACPAFQGVLISIPSKIIIIIPQRRFQSNKSAF